VNRPYLETKIVKVKKKEKCRMFKECYRCGQEYVCMMERNKEKKCNHLNAPCIHTYIYNGVIRCPQCGKILTLEWLKKRIIIDPLLVEEKGNWVNGENLDAIKFPCFCSYENNQTRFLGEINSSFRIGHGQEYILSYVEGQGDTSIVEQNKSLKNLIEVHNIHILKGKIIIFEEEK